MLLLQYHVSLSIQHPDSTLYNKKGVIPLISGQYCKFCMYGYDYN